MPNAILLISCADQKGITAAVTGFIAQNQGNIIHADQHIDEQSNTFFMRIEWSLEGFGYKAADVAKAFDSIAVKFHMTWELHFSNERPRMAVYVSKHLHCLVDVLNRHRFGQFACDIPLILSNHPEAKEIASAHKIAFHEYPMFKDNKGEQEARQLALLREHRIDLIVLARYHQILTPGFVEQYKNRIINIHHSFLPAFAGKSPYQRAYQKGVKLIGATSHYVTAELDEGPIIEQDTVRISHRDNLQALIQKGEELEKVVLSRALRWHLERKILCYGNKTVVFD